MKTNRILVFFIAFTAILQAQKKELTLKESILGPYRELTPDNIKGLQWIPKTNSYVFVSNDVLKKANAYNQQNSEVITLADLNAKTGKNLKRFPGISWINANQFYFKSGNTYFKYDIKRNSVKSYDFD